MREQLNSAADRSIKSGLKKYLGEGFSRAPDPVDFNFYIYDVSASWTWSIKSKIKSENRAGNFSENERDRYYNSADDAMREAESFAELVSQGDLGYREKLEIALAEQPMAERVNLI